MPTEDSESKRVAQEPDVSLTHRITDALPPALEELALDFYELFWHDLPGEDGYESRQRDVTNWRVEIAASKPTAFPALETVRFSVLYLNLVEIDQQVSKSYEEAGIELHMG